MSWRPGSAVLSLATVAALVPSACGGRTQLIPAHQIGRLSPDAVVAREGDVRVVVRTDAWTGQTVEPRQLFPVELTVDNGSTRPLRLRGQDVALVMPDGQRMGPFNAADLELANPARDNLATRALSDGVVTPGARVSGFLYFPELPDEDDLQLRIELIDATSGTRFGVIEIPFYVD